MDVDSHTVSNVLVFVYSHTTVIFPHYSVTWGLFLTKGSTLSIRKLPLPLIVVTVLSSIFLWPAAVKGNHTSILLLMFASSPEIIFLPSPYSCGGGLFGVISYLPSLFP